MDTTDTDVRNDENRHLLVHYSDETPQESLEDLLIRLRGMFPDEAELPSEVPPREPAEPAGDATEAAEVEPSEPTEAEKRVELRRLLMRLAARAQDGDAEAAAKMTRTLDAHPELWLGLGDAGAAAERQAIEFAGSENPLLTQSLTRFTAELREQLLRKRPTVLERMAVQRVIICWLATLRIENLFARSTEGILAERRLCEAYKSLEFVRKMKWRPPRRSRKKATAPAAAAAANVGAGQQPSPSAHAAEQTGPSKAPAAAV